MGSVEQSGGDLGGDAGGKTKKPRRIAFYGASGCMELHNDNEKMLPADAVDHRLTKPEHRPSPRSS